MKAMKTLFILCLILIGRQEWVLAIVGGTDANKGDVPWIVSLARTSHFCAGSILDKRTVLTTAQCVDGASVTTIRVRVGSLTHASGGTTVSISRIVSHSQYNPSLKDYDIAILKTSSDIPIDGTNVKAVTLPSAEPTAGAAVMAAGWGVTSQGSGTLPSTLKRVTVNVVSLTQCQSGYGQSSITGRMTCAGVIGGGKDSCKGDNGGPLTLNGVQYGIYSWGKGCAQAAYPGVYTNVAALRTWITSNMS